MSGAEPRIDDNVNHVYHSNTHSAPITYDCAVSEYITDNQCVNVDNVKCDNDSYVTFVRVDAISSPTCEYVDGLLSPGLSEGVARVLRSSPKFQHAAKILYECPDRTSPWNPSPPGIVTTDNLVKIYNAVKATNKFNYQHARIELETPLNLPAWRFLLKDYSDPLL